MIQLFEAFAGKISPQTSAQPAKDKGGDSSSSKELIAQNDAAFMAMLFQMFSSPVVQQPEPAEGTGSKTTETITPGASEPVPLPEHNASQSDPAILDTFVAQMVPVVPEEFTADAGLLNSLSSAISQDQQRSDNIDGTAPLQQAAGTAKTAISDGFPIDWKSYSISSSALGLQQVDTTKALQVIADKYTAPILNARLSQTLDLNSFQGPAPHEGVPRAAESAPPDVGLAHPELAGGDDVLVWSRTTTEPPGDMMVLPRMAINEPKLISAKMAGVSSSHVEDVLAPIQETAGTRKSISDKAENRSVFAPDDQVASKVVAQKATSEAQLIGKNSLPVGEMATPKVDGNDALIFGNRQIENRGTTNTDSLVLKPETTVRNEPDIRLSLSTTSGSLSQSKTRTGASSILVNPASESGISGGAVKSADEVAQTKSEAPARPGGTSTKSQDFVKDESSRSLPSQMIAENLGVLPGSGLFQKLSKGPQKETNAEEALPQAGRKTAPEEEEHGGVSKSNVAEESKSESSIQPVSEAVPKHEAQNELLNRGAGSELPQLQAQSKTDAPGSSTATLRQSVPLVQIPDDFARNLVVRISDELKAHIDGKASEVRVVMKPESMGELSLRVSMEDGKLAARMDVTQPAVKAALEAQLPQLREALATQGIEIQRFDIQAGSAMQFQGSGDKRAFQQRRQSKIRESVDAVETFDNVKFLGYNTVEYII